MMDDQSVSAVFRRELEGEVGRLGRELPRKMPCVVAVSKTMSRESIRPLIEEGWVDFGENRVKEAEEKWGDWEERRRVMLHMVGSLQTNKARRAVELFDVIHTLDRESLAKILSGLFGEFSGGQKTRLFVQVNMSGEGHKHGVSRESVGDFVDFCRHECGLVLDGLMCMASQTEDEEEIAHQFGWLSKRAGELGLRGLSMGMSGDWRVALSCGATHLRIGSALFGARVFGTRVFGARR